MNRRRRCVLVVDDEFVIAASLRMQIEAMGIEVCGMAATAHEAIALAEKHRPSVVVMDVRLKGREDGVDAASQIRSSIGSTVIFLTGSREPAMIERIEAACPANILFKPILSQQLEAAIEEAFRI
jgi:two-component system, response regulator PdtaR